MLEHEKHDGPGSDELNRALDRTLDAALAKYSAVEPRAGLEQRILANLRAQAGQSAPMIWWRWAAAGVGAAVVIVAIALALRAGKPVERQVASPPPAKSGAGQQARITSPDIKSTEKNHVARVLPRHQSGTNALHPERLRIAARPPRLDQFPSPQPMTEQERLMVRYVRDFPQEAVVVAQMQAESEKQMEQRFGNQSPDTLDEPQDKQDKSER